MVNTCPCLFRWVAAESIEDAAQLLNLPVSRIQQDTDVLDTWFSSALIPLVVAGDWPAHRNLDFPLLDVMQTGHDIIGFWIARMMTMCHRSISRSYQPKVFLQPHRTISVHSMFHARSDS